MVESNEALRAHRPPTPSNAFTFAYVAWMISLVAMLGSLFFGEVMKLPPCTLCWYQRICLFPLPLLMAVAIVRRDTAELVAYAAPLAAVGAVIAGYHNLVDYGVVSEALTPCAQGVSCRTRYVEWLGFVTIPLLSFGAFVSILTCLLLHRRQERAHA
jgi:disulfide bond formation protein DsbB